jgi:hypothetical protein
VTKNDRGLWRRWRRCSLALIKDDCIDKYHDNDDEDNDELPIID